MVGVEKSERELELLDVVFNVVRNVVLNEVLDVMLDDDDNVGRRSASIYTKKRKSILLHSRDRELQPGVSFFVVSLLEVLRS